MESVVNAIGQELVRLLSPFGFKVHYRHVPASALAESSQHGEFCWELRVGEAVIRHVAKLAEYEAKSLRNENFDKFVNRYAAMWSEGAVLETLNLIAKG